MDQNEPEKATEEIKELLEKSVEINQENNEILKSMKRATRVGLALNVVKWFIIVGSFLGLYYYFGELFGGVIDQFNGLLNS